MVKQVKLYKVISGATEFEGFRPGTYAGNRTGKIFGTLDCKAGKRMEKENRVFFEDLESAVLSGYRPCKNCRPVGEDEWESVRRLIPKYDTLEDWYDRDKK